MADSNVYPRRGELSGDDRRIGAAYRPPSWNRCDVCGKFIAFDEFANQTAVHRLLEPDSDLGSETWDTYHKRCDEQTEPC